MSCSRGVIQATTRAAPCRRLAAAEKAGSFQALQCRIDLAQFGWPEIVNAFVENCFEVVAAGWLTEQPKQDMIQAHVATI
jgi:hypothetical protein